MKQDDIEKILQQYGADRRQQQQLSDTLHRMARRQRRGVLALCTVVLLVATVWTLRQQATPQRLDGAPIAHRESPTDPLFDNTTPKPQTTTPTGGPESTPTAAPANNQQRRAVLQPESHTHCELAVAETPIADPDGHSGSGDNAEPEVAPYLEAPTPEIPVPESPIHVVNPYESEGLLLADNAVYPLSDTPDRRIRLAASVGASVFPNAGGAAVVGIEQNGLLDDGASFRRVMPSTTFSAHVGVNYSIPLGGRHGLDVGVGVSGYTYLEDMTEFTITNQHGDDGIDPIVSPVGEPRTSTTFKLYASVPFAFHFKTRGKVPGWNLSITPSHILTTSRALTVMAPNVPVINPWRLSAGIGVALPHGFVRRVSLAVNLLPFYTSSSIHEIGIEIGF